MKLNNNPRLWWGMFFILMAFNIAVFGTLGYFFLSHRVVFEKVKPEEIRETFHEMKEFRPDIHSKYRNQIRPLNDKNRELRIKFLKELIKPEPEYDSLLVLSNQIQEITLNISMNFYKEMLEMRKALSPEEAQQFYGHHLKMMESRFMHPRDGEELRGQREEFGMGHGMEHGDRGRRGTHRVKGKENRRTQD